MSGEPTIFQKISKATLERRVDSYFETVKKQRLPASLTGLALHIGCTRQNILTYKDTDEFGEILVKAKLRCENVLEERMIAGAPPTGLIFILKNNYGWHDKVESEVNLTGNISLSALFDQAAKKRLEEQKKEEIVEGEIITTEAPALLFDNENTKESLPADIF